MVVPMVPWWRGFKGEIKQTTKNRYDVSGVVKKLNETTVMELPVGEVDLDLQGGRRWLQGRRTRIRARRCCALSLAARDILPETRIIRWVSSSPRSTESTYL